MRPLHGCLNQALLCSQIVAVEVQELKPVGVAVVELLGMQVVAAEVLADQAGRSGMAFVHGASAEKLF